MIYEYMIIWLIPILREISKYIILLGICFYYFYIVLNFFYTISDNFKQKLLNFKDLILSSMIIATLILIFIPPIDIIEKIQMQSQLL